LGKAIFVFRPWSIVVSFKSQMGFASGKPVHHGRRPFNKKANRK